MREWIVNEEDLGCDGAYFSYTELVRCKDCKWWVPHGKGTPASIPALGECGYKKFSGCLTMLCEFCFWGERKDNATND